MPLITPIANRKQSDVDYANSLIKKAKKAGWDNLSTSEKATYLSGMLGSLKSTDLNRIESNCAYLAGLLNQYGYNLTISIKTDWAQTDNINAPQLERIRSNLALILDVYHLDAMKTFEDLGNTTFAELGATTFEDLKKSNLMVPMVPTTYVKINTIEDIIGIVDDMIAHMKLSFRKSGTFRSGQRVSL